MVNIHSFTFNALQENTYILWNEEKNCIVIDPGCYELSEQKEISGFIESNHLKVQEILNTHCHIDHVLGNYYLKNFYKVKLGIHTLEEPVLRAVKAYAPSYGIHKYEAAEPDFFIKSGEEITLGKTKIKTLFVPGHSPGHLAFYIPEQKMCISGDVLFFNSIGRTNLPGGDYDTLIKSIKTELFGLPDDVKIYPGHGPLTTIGQEKKTNPFVKI